MQKKLIFIEAPVDTFSGYGKHSVDIVKSLFTIYPETEWDYLIAPTRWGTLPSGALNDNDPIEAKIKSKFIQSNQLPKKPEIHIQITIPSEFRPLGIFSIGITAGTESSLASMQFLDGCNKMDLTIVPSAHVKTVLETSKWIQKDPTGQVTNEIKTIKPIEVLFEGINLDIYTPEKPNATDVSVELDKIKEDFNFLFVGHWLKGDLGSDRKDVGMLIKTFLETFKNLEDAPGLVLKTNMSSFSLLDKDQILEKIAEIKKKVVATKLPNIYVFHGEVTDSEMNELYHHKKIKAMISFTKGEGFGRPLLEFSVTGKPVMVSNWSGQLDFLPGGNAVLLKGKLEKIHDSAVWEHILLKDSLWFTVDYDQASVKMNYMVNNYGKYIEMGRKQKNNAIKNFSLDKMSEKFKIILDKYVPKFPNLMDIKLPTLKRISNENSG